MIKRSLLALGLLALPKLASGKATFKNRQPQADEHNAEGGIWKRNKGKMPKVKELKWETPVISGNTESISEGSAFVCESQPQGAWGSSSDTCKDNADCGTALCVSVHKSGWTDGTFFKKCGCSSFEERFKMADGKYQHVQTCSCMDKGVMKNICLPVWRRSIMCKFACTDCRPCQEKMVFSNGDHPLGCQADPTCKTVEVAGVNKCVDSDGECGALATSGDCVQDLRCKWMKVTQHWDASIAQFTAVESAVEACKPRYYSEAYLESDNNGATVKAFCPIGTQRVVEKYQDVPNTFYDVCLPVREGQVGISNCRFYQWDGESCKECQLNYKPGQVALERGNGKIKKNAICVSSVNEFNKNCAIFTYKLDAEGGGHNHHHCARCMEGYEWPQLEGGTVNNAREQGKCTREHKQNGSVLALYMKDTRVFLMVCFLFGAVVTLAGSKVGGVVFGKFGLNDTPLNAVNALR